ncbi:MAG: HAD-IA family hydrolase [Synergistaceae bacterium]|nr:HAD-IA family hydrolase [Synergistaceae bacterium]
MNLKAILFDLDGTLLDTLGDIAGCANYALASFGFGEHPVDAYRRFVGSGVDRLIERAVRPGPLTPETASRVKKLYLDRYAELTRGVARPYDGVPDLLSKLRQFPLKLAVVSNKPDDQTRRSVSLHFADDAFDAVVGAREGTPLKPDPTVVRNVLGDLAVAHGEALYVGDTGVDMAAAKNAGCASVGVTWGFRPDEIREANADYIIGSPAELLEIAGSLGPGVLDKASEARK